MNFKKISVIKEVSGPYKGNIIILLFLTCFNALLEGLNVGLYLPIIGWATSEDQQGAFDKILLYLFGEMKRSDKILYGITVLAIVVLLKTIIKLFMNWYAVTLYTNLRNYWISSLHDGFLTSPMLDFYKSRNGEKLNLMGNEANLATQAVSDFIGLIMRLTVVSAYFVVLLIASWFATVCFVIVITFFALLYIKIGKKKIIMLAHQRHHNDSGQTAFLNESLIGVKQIKIYGLYENVRRKLWHFLSTYQELTRKQDFLEKMPVPLGELVLIVFGALGLFYLQMNDTSSLIDHIPKVGVFILALKPLLTQITDAASLKIGFDNRWKSIDIINQAIQSFSNSEGFGTQKNMFPLKNGISCQKLIFSYEQNKEPVFNGLNCFFPSAGLVLVKGSSGKGKTTLIDLIQGFYKNYQGKILFDDLELKELDLHHVRNNIGYVTQDHYFFHGSVRENLIGNKKVSDEEIQKVLQTTAAWDYIYTLPGQLDSILSEGASSLSGGQRQRLSIARAILRDPSILVLDEPTNALDNNSRDIVINSLYELAQRKCVIIVTHDETSFNRPETQTVIL